MTYLRIDDNMPDHPKIVGLTDGAFRLYVGGLCYSARHLTDGIIPLSAVPRLSPAFKPRHFDELVSRLLWVRLSANSWVEIHDFLDWNYSRESVLNRRQTARQNALKRWDDKGGWIG